MKEKRAVRKTRIQKKKRTNQNTNNHFEMVEKKFSVQMEEKMRGW